MNISGAINAGEAVMFCYIGLVFGDFISGFLSQYFQSRKKIVLMFLVLSSISIALYFMLHGASSSLFYSACGIIGFAVGYWAIFITIAAEQFGTNIRATVASTVPNFIRGTVIPITFLFQIFKKYFGILNAGVMVGALCMLIAFYALYRLEETFHKDLNYIEE
jgi:MFS family permease